MEILAMSLREYLETVASRSPTPGGGCVSAVAGANAAAMICMVAELTSDRKGYEHVQGEIGDILAQARAIMTELTSLAGRDMEAFGRLVQAWRLPAETEVQRQTKAQEKQHALRNATTVPLAIAAQCLDLLKLSLRIAPLGNKTAVSDIGVGIYLAEAALRAALLNVEINLPSIGDVSLRNTMAREKAALLTEAGAFRAPALAEVEKRLAQG